MTPRPTVERTCRYPGCRRDTVGSSLGGSTANLCCLHDGMREPLVCHCRAAYPDSIGQCTVCWRVIVRLHPILLDAWPELAHQPLANEAAA